MNDINEMPPKCQYCPYWEVCEYPWVCPDMWQQDEESIQPNCNQLATDTISRQAAIDAICRSSECESEFCGIPCTEVNALKALPSAQPEIIRCKDCKHWTQSTGKMKGYGLGRCDFHDADLVTCNGFCYWAEGRTDG